MTLTEKMYLVDGTEATVTELIEVGEEIGGDFKSAELEEEVRGLGSGVLSFGSAAGFECLAQAGAETRQKPHQRINRTDLRRFFQLC